MGIVNSASLKTATVEGGLYDYVLLSVNAPAYFMPFPRGYIQLVPETAKFKTVLTAGRSAVIAGSQYLFIPDYRLQAGTYLTLVAAIPLPS